MRYLFVSDVHGEYDKMIDALSQAQFNKDADTLVCLGDMFDRGPQSREVLEFILDLPNVIIVWGNHELRLRELVYGFSRATNSDIHNGVLATLKSFIGDDTDFQSKSKSPSTLNLLLRIFRTDDRCGKIRRKLDEYFGRCIWGLEFKDIVAVHGWIPTWNDGFDEKGIEWHSYMEDWRVDIPKWVWEDATWDNGYIMTLMQCGPKDKKMLVGHIHAWRIAQANGLAIWDTKDTINEDKWELKMPEELSLPREYENTIFIDGCVSLPEGKVIVYEYNTEGEPFQYDRTVVR